MLSDAKKAERWKEKYKKEKQKSYRLYCLYHSAISDLSYIKEHKWGYQKELTPREEIEKIRDFAGRQYQRLRKGYDL